jgi:hypothetical protein
LLIIAAAALGLMVVGTRYLVADEFMPYHAQVAQTPWTELAPGVRAIILGFLTIVGAGFIACGAALLWLLPVLRAGARWGHWAVLSVGLLLGLPTLFVTLKLRQEAPGAETPVALTVFLVVCVVVGALVYKGSLRRGSRQAEVTR